MSAVQSTESAAVGKRNKTEKPFAPIVIVPSKGWVSLKLGHLWEFRELLFFMTWRDITVRYKQTVLGILWAVLQPFMTMIVFSLFFGGLARVPSDGVPYPIFSYSALVAWHFFANALTHASVTLTTNANLLKKVYFPRLVLPISTVMAGVVDFALAFGILIVMMIVYGITPTANIIWLPAFLLLALITSLGVSLWLSAMNVRFRDVRHTLPFLTQFWLFITPIAYPSSLIENPVLRAIYSVNPMAGVVDGFRWALLGTNTPPTVGMAISVAVSVLLLISGLFYFRRMEKTFADMV